MTIAVAPNDGCSAVQTMRLVAIEIENEQLLWELLRYDPGFPRAGQDVHRRVPHLPSTKGASLVVASRTRCPFRASSKMEAAAA